MTTPLRILVDLDGVVTDLHTPWLAAYGAEHDHHLTHADLLQYDVHQLVHPHVGVRVYDYIREPGFFDNLEPFDGAVEALHALEAAGHEVLICSAPASPDSARAKLEWVRDTLGWNRKRVILTHRKELVSCHVFIDDAPDNLLAMHEAQPDVMTVCMGYGYNRHLLGEVDLYATDYWESPRARWRAILAELATGAQIAAAT